MQARAHVASAPQITSVRSSSTPPVLPVVPSYHRRSGISHLLRRPLTLGSLGLSGLLVLLCLLASWLAPIDPTAIDLGLGLQSPSLDHWLGTDQFGRDVWSRVLWAGRTSIGIASIVLTVTVTLGAAVGLITGYSGGWLDDLGMRITEFCDGLPQVVVALALIGAAGPSTLALVLALSVTGWARYARLTRSLVLRARVLEYVTAATAIGATAGQIVRRHLLPTLAGPVAVQLSLDAGATVLAIAGLSFLGLGIQPPTPEWGAMLVEARPYLDFAPHLVLSPGVALFLLVLGCNTLGEWLDDLLRPQG
jgi:ABC-type dipeptide/oligopeptide/nickel transport system permease subunit